MRRKDAISIAFWMGASLIMLLFGVFYLAVKSSDPDDDNKNKEFVTSVNTLRLTFVVIYILFCTAMAIKVFLNTGINYLYIFELDPNSKMTSDQLFKVSAVLLFFWSLCFTMTMGEIKMEWIFHDYPAYPVIIMFLFFLVYCFQCCFKCGYRIARFQLLITIYEILISPFGRVRFRDFFFADVITSIGTSMGDIGICIFYITHDNYKHYDDDKY